VRYLEILRDDPEEQKFTTTIQKEEAAILEEIEKTTMIKSSHDLKKLSTCLLNVKAFSRRVLCQFKEKLAQDEFYEDIMI